MSVPGDAKLGPTGATIPLAHSISAPPAVLNLPQAQVYGFMTPLVFSPANQNAISLNDPGAGNQSVQVALSVQGGTLTLGNTSGVTITAGGNGQATMNLSGTVAAINHALVGLAANLSQPNIFGDVLSITLSDVVDGEARTITGTINLVGSEFNAGTPVNSFTGPLVPGPLAAPVITVPNQTLPVTGSPIAITGVSVAGTPWSM